jgi:competence protein ComEC
MPLVWPALGFAVGLFLGASWNLSPLPVMLLLAALPGGYVLSRPSGLRLGMPALLVAGLLLGVLRGGPELLLAPGLSEYHGSSVELRGVVRGLPELVGSRVRLRMDVAEARTPRPRSHDSGWRDAGGRVVAWVDGAIEPVDGRVHPFMLDGDGISISGSIVEPQPIGAFDYREHLLARGIGSVVSQAVVLEVAPADGFGPMRALHAARGRLARAIERHVPEPQAALTTALVLGLRGGLSRETSEQFRDSGLAHLLAVSGMHVGVMLGTSLVAAAWLFGRRRGLYLIAPLLILWAYVLLAGAPASAVRAGVVGTAYLLALWTGRASVPVNALGIATLAMLALDPRAAWDRSFQLSFAALAGVLLIGLPAWAWVSQHWTCPALARRLDPLTNRTLHGTAAAALVSGGAVLGSLPLVAFNFGQVPVWGIPATLLALPLLPLLLVSGFATALVGIVIPPLATLVGLVPAAAAGFVMAEASFVSGLPMSTAGAGWVTVTWV